MRLDEFQFYYELIVFVVFLTSIIISRKYRFLNKTIALSFIICLTIFIGFRPEDIGTDTTSYQIIFYLARSSSINDIINNLKIIGSDPLFKIILIIGHIIGSYTSVLVIISFLTLYWGYRFCERLCNYLGINYSISLFCCYLISFYIFGQQINIIRAGLAAVFLLNYYLSVFQSDKKSAIWYGVIAIGIHFSSIFGILLPLIAKYIKLSKRIYIIGFFVALILAYANFGVLNIPLFSNIDLDRKGYYLTSESEKYITGFRTSFALFNSFFAIIFYKYIRQQNSLYQSFFRLYILFSILFFLCFQIPYSDRIGAFSWNIIPFITYFCASQVFKLKEKKAMIYTFLCLFVIQFGVSLLS